MIKTVYVVHVSYNLYSAEGDCIEYNGENYYADTIEEAYKIADRHQVGEIECEYSDGCYGVIDSVEIDPEPLTADFF